MICSLKVVARARKTCAGNNPLKTYSKFLHLLGNDRVSNILLLDLVRNKIQPDLPNIE
jgi:hypothetical protein